MRRPFNLNRHLAQRLGFTFITLMAIATVLPIVATVIYILVKGLPAISLEFLTDFPRDGMRAGESYQQSLALYISRLVRPFSLFRLGSRPQFISPNTRQIRRSRVRYESLLSILRAFHPLCTDCSVLVYLYSSLISAHPFWLHRSHFRS